MCSRLPSISVIIPTKDRPCDLKAALSSLFAQTTAFHQLIIVDQSLSSETSTALKRYWAEAPARIRDAVKLDYIWDMNIPGAAVARNRAMEIAEGDIWLFLDDDVILETDFLKEILAVYSGYPEVTGVSGIVTNYRPPSWQFRLWDLIFVRGPFHDERQAIYWKADRLQGANPIAVGKFGAGLMSFRARAVKGIRFDGNLRGVPAGEDVDFCMRLQSGALLMIAPRARLIHNRSSTTRSQQHHIRRDLQSAHYLYRRNWNYGINNRLCFLWLTVGYALMATLASVRRRSLDPWRALVGGFRDARRIAP
jgi:GT2 family glycosyltransferase